VISDFGRLGGLGEGLMRDLVYRYVMTAAGNLAARARSLSGTVFCFHSVTPKRASMQQESSLSVSVDFISLLLMRLRDLGIPVVSLDEALARKQSRDRSRFAALTFDDGYIDNCEVLHPLMEDAEVPYTIFVTSALIDRTMPLWWDALEQLVGSEEQMVLNGQIVPLSAGRKSATLKDLLEKFKTSDPAGQRRLFDEIAFANPAIRVFKPYESCMSWDMLRDMNASPLLTVGAHTQSHPMLSRLSVEAIRSELTTSRNAIADQLGCAVDYLAYPFGQPFEYGPDAPLIAQQVGYKAAFTTSHGDWFEPGVDLFTLPRVLIANKAQHPDIPLAYMSPWPRRIKSLVGQVA
jgi:peptidoglycan/xylan/chitin deacetylase (PgdA/CDA1 family)